VPINSGDSNANHFYSPDRDILDVSHWVQEPPVPLATSMQDHFSGTSPDKSLPSYDLYSPYQIVEPWDPSLQDHMEDIALSLFPASQPLDYTFYSSNSPVETRSNCIPTDEDGDTSSLALQPLKAPEFRNILPMPPPLPSDAVSDTNSDDITQQRPAKPCQRRCLTEDEKKATARMRKIGACARCIAKKIRVSSG
jgi:hypothetical protein